MAQKFLRRTWSRYAKLGKRVKKNQKWRKPTGRDNKMREKRRGYPVVVSIGYKKSEEERIKPLVIQNIRELEKVGNNQKVVVGNVGKKKKLEIVNAAKQKKIQISNLNIEKFLKQNKPKTKKSEDKK